MYQPCKTCPFRENPTAPGSADWLVDIIRGILSGSMNHSCHMTDRKADLYSGRKKERLCMGFLGMMKRHRNECISSRALRQMVEGTLDWEKVPTKGVFENPATMAEYHLAQLKLPLPEEAEEQPVDLIVKAIGEK